MFYKKRLLLFFLTLFFYTQYLNAQCFFPLFYTAHSDCKKDKDTSRFYEKELPFISWRKNELTGRIGSAVAFGNSFLGYDGKNTKLPMLNISIIEGGGIIEKRFMVGGGVSLLVPLKTILKDETTGFQDFSIKQNIGANFTTSLGYYLAFFDKSALSVQGNVSFQVNSIGINRNITSTNTINWANFAQGNRYIDYNNLLDNMRNSEKDNISMLKWSGIAQLGLVYDYLLSKEYGWGVQISGGYQTTLGFMDSDWQLNKNRDNNCNCNTKKTRIGNVPISISQDDFYLKFGIFKYFNKNKELVPKEEN